MATQKDTTLALINTNIVNKPAKISPADHRAVSLAIVDCIDNRFIIAGTQALVRTAAYDQIFTIIFNTVDTINYNVVFSISSSTVAWQNAANYITIKDKGTASFNVLMRAVDGNAPANITFEYALFRTSEPS
tara:strand:- start:8784 stop:9179 length:396 start_codon:yes stop_codon:yes gene_type:complete